MGALRGHRPQLINARLPWTPGLSLKISVSEVPRVVLRSLLDNLMGP